MHSLCTLSRVVSCAAAVQKHRWEKCRILLDARVYKLCLLLALLQLDTTRKEYFTDIRISPFIILNNYLLGIDLSMSHES